MKMRSTSSSPCAAPSDELPLAATIIEPGLERIRRRLALNNRADNLLILLGGDQRHQGLGRGQFGDLLGNDVADVILPDDVVGGAKDEGLEEVDAEEANEVDEGGDEGEDGSEFGEGNDVEGGGGADLVAPTVEEVVGDGEEEGEEDSVGEVERERESIGGLRGGGRGGCSENTPKHV